MIKYKSSIWKLGTVSLLHSMRSGVVCEYFFTLQYFKVLLNNSASIGILFSRRC